MSLIEHDCMIETLSPYRTNKALAVRILPGRPWRTEDLSDAHVRHAMLKHVAEDAIAITNQKTGRSIIGKRFDNLLGRPLGCRMRGDVEMHDVPVVVAHHHKANSMRNVAVGTVKKSIATMSVS